MEENNQKIKKENSFLFSTSLIFDENIDKLWLYLRDISAGIKYVNFLDNFKFIKGDNTWTVGNVFSLYWIGVSNIEVKCLSSSVTRTKKKIKWKFKCEIGISYYKTMNLYRITNSDKTLVKVNLTRCEKNSNVDFGPQTKYYLNLQYDILNSQTNYLHNIKKDKKLYESCIINLNHLKIWNFITDLKNLLIIFPEYLKKVDYNGPIGEIGTFIKINIKDFEKTIFLRIVDFSFPTKRKTYKCTFEAVGTDLVNLPHIIEIQLNIIEANKTHLSFFINFGSKASKQVLNGFDINLKKLINKLLDYMNENEERFKDG